MDWYDRHQPGADTLRIRTGHAQYVVRGAVVVQSFGNVFAEYGLHPGAKAAGADGRPVEPWSRGLLQPQRVTMRVVARR
jgi:hypothetical protein